MPGTPPPPQQWVGARHQTRSSAAVRSPHSYPIYDTREHLRSVSRERADAPRGDSSSAAHSPMSPQAPPAGPPRSRHRSATRRPRVRAMTPTGRVSVSDGPADCQPPHASVSTGPVDTPAGTRRVSHPSRSGSTKKLVPVVLRAGEGGRRGRRGAAHATRAGPARRGAHRRGRAEALREDRLGCSVTAGSVLRGRSGPRTLQRPGGALGAEARCRSTAPLARSAAASPPGLR